MSEERPNALREESDDGEGWIGPLPSEAATIEAEPKSKKRKSNLKLFYFFN